MVKIFLLLLLIDFVLLKLVIMIKKLPVFIFVILLSFSNLAFSQVVNPYADFGPEELKNHKEYSKNFNAGNYSTKIFYNCLSDLIDAARKQYAYLEPLKHDIAFDSTAQMQADFQALKNERTDLNVAPYKTTFFRLKKYGLSHRGEELVSKGKAYIGIQDFSYYDACMELVRPILKNLKQAAILLDPQYTYVGLGFETDEFMKSMYASIVLGNDRTFTLYTYSPIDKLAPMSKGKGGMDHFDAAICRKCVENFPLEALSEYISVNRDGEVYLECEDYKELKRLIGREGDAIVLDFVQTSQYDCDNIIVDNDKIFRGFVTKSITYEDIFANNEVTEKSLRLRAKIADVPEMIELDAEYEINVIVLKEGVACRTIMKKYIEAYNANFTEKINFMKDEKSIKTAGEWMPTAETAELEVRVPFTNLKKLNYVYSDFDTLIQQLDVPEYQVNSIEVVAVNSINYIKDPVQIKNQKLRATSIQKALAAVYPNAAITISYGDSWEEFKRDIVNHSEYYDLSFDKETAIATLRADNGRAAKEIEEEYLSKERYAKIIFHVTYNISSKTNEQDFVIYKFNKALEEKNQSLAFAIQKYVMGEVENQRYKSSAVNKMQIPNQKAYVPFLNNKLYMQYYLEKTLQEETAKDMIKLLSYQPDNQILIYNKTVCDVYATPITSAAKALELQTQIDKLYTFQNVNKEEVNNLNIDYQIKILEFLKTAPNNNENKALKTSTYEKIKTIRNPIMPSWESAYRLASIFVQNHDYDYALDIMTPFLDDPHISEDFLFSYISLAGHKESTYMSSLFTKAVKLAKERNLSYLCSIINKLSICVLDNEEVRKITCEFCK